MALTSGPSERGRRPARTGGGGTRRGRGTAAASTDLHPLAAAYVLDALDERQREAFAAHLPDCAACQEALALAPGPLAALTVAAPALAAAPPTLAATLRAVVIDVLPQTSQVEVAWTPAQVPPPDVPVGGDAPSDAPTTRVESLGDPLASGRSTPGPTTPGAATASNDRAVDAPSWDAWAHRGPAAPDYDDEGRSPTPRGTTAETEGRPRPGLPPELVGGWTESDDRGRPSRAGVPLLALVAVAILAVGMLVWAMMERRSVGDIEGELAAQRTVVAEIRANANAASFTIVPTEDGPTAAAGTAFFSLPAMRGALVLEGMPALPEDLTYQIWFVAPDGAVTAGPTARADSEGSVVIPIDATGLVVERLYVTAAPIEGATVPDFDQYPALMLGILGGATG